MIDEWEYPAIGVAICDCPSAGHDMIFWIIGNAARSREPKVAHVNQENDYKITPLAKNFEKFILSLVNEAYFEIEDRQWLHPLRRLLPSPESDVPPLRRGMALFLVDVGRYICVV